MPSRTKRSPSMPLAFDAVLPRDPRVEVRRLFGNPVGYVNGNMFTSVHDRRWVVRLSLPERERLLQVEGAEVFEPMKGKPMPEYVKVPLTIVSDSRKLRSWVKRAFEYCASLPSPRAVPLTK